MRWWRRRDARRRPPPPPTTTQPPQVCHAARDLEALLPATINGTTLEKGSANGAGVFGGDAFSREMTQRLAAAGKAPADLRFANAQNPKDSSSRSASSRCRA